MENIKQNNIIGTEVKKTLVIFPVLFGFFVMGFVDVVGIATNYIKEDFALSDILANLLPMMVFLWFAICAIPAGLLMGRIGRRNTVLVSMAITAIAMLLPICSYEFVCLLIAFTLLGIGNTLLQVSLNPMVAGIVRGELLVSILTLGQFIKAVSSFLGPILAGVAAIYCGSWKLIFIVYMIATLLSMAWLLFAVPSDHSEEKKTTLRSVWNLFSEHTILILFIGILAVVGIDVGLNTAIPKFLMERTGISLTEAGLGISLYFAARTIGTFIGAVLLVKISSRVFMIACMGVATASFVFLLFARELWLLSVLIILIGLACSNAFSIIFSYALRYLPERSNEISALMIMGVSGGALVMPIMGWLSDSFGQVIGLLPLLCCIFYLGYISLKMKPVK
ncbi:MFS transporter [Phocaeicola sp. HCN-6420]|uniref:MFS transporter n=1 Tax=Phocaeicola sp. HCN-6420 TaxID=3134673 RepID=UPI0030C1CB1F